MSLKKTIADTITTVINGERITYRTRMYVPAWITDSLARSATMERWDTPILSAEQLAKKITSLDRSRPRALIYASYPDALGTDLMETFSRTSNSAIVLKALPAALSDMKRKVIGNISGRNIRTFTNARVNFDFGQNGQGVAAGRAPLYFTANAFGKELMDDHIRKNWELRLAIYPFTKKGHALLGHSDKKALLSIVRSITSRQLELQAFESLLDTVDLNGIIHTVNAAQKPSHNDTYPDLDDIHARFWRPGGLELYDREKDRTFDLNIAGEDIVVPSIFDVTGISQQAFEQMLERSTAVDQLFITGIIDQHPKRLLALLATTNARHIFIDRSVYLALRTSGWETDDRIQVFNYQDELTRQVLSSASLWRIEGQ